MNSWTRPNIDASFNSLGRTSESCTSSVVTSIDITSQQLTGIAGRYNLP
jgi:hypothetical protein